MAATASIPDVRRPAAMATHVLPSKLTESLNFVCAPFLLPACAFAFGVVAASLRWWMPAWLLAGLLLLGAAAAAAAWRAPPLVLPTFALFFVCLGCFAAEMEPPVNPQSALVALAGTGEPVTFTGVAVRLEPPHTTSFTDVFRRSVRIETARRVDLQLSGYRRPGGTEIPLTGGLRLTLYGTEGSALPPIFCGSRLEAQLTLHPESHYLDPGVWDAGAYLLSRGIGASGSSPASLVRLKGMAQPTLGCRLHALQTTASERVMGLAAMPAGRRLPAFLKLTATDASMLTAMLTGDRSYLQRPTRTGFERTGSFHLLVVSGMHLAIFSSVILFSARKMRLSKLAATLTTIGLSFAYAMFTGFGEPVQRSFWMVTLYLLGRLIFRERHALQAMAVAALLLIAASPRALTGASLQMTLLTVVAIAGFAAPLAERSFGPYLRGMRDFWLVAVDAAMPPKVAQLRVTLRLLALHLQPVVGRRLARQWMPACVRFSMRVCELVAISAIVELVMALPMAVYFHRITVVGLPVNVLIIPLLGLLLPAAMLCFATMVVSPPLAVVPAAATAALLHTISAVIGRFSRLEAGNYRLPGPPMLRVVAWVLLIAMGVWVLRRRERWALAGGGALLLGATVLAVAPQPVRHDPRALQISTLDVGQGDAILIITPDGKTMLVDAGGLVGQAPGNSFDIGEEVVSPALWSRGICRLDAVAITHAHLDHIGGMPAVLANFHPRVLLVGNNPVSSTYAAVLAEAGAEHVPVQAHFAGDRWRLGSETEVSTLWPSRSYKPKAEPGNNDSLVLQLRYASRKALLEGDAQSMAETAMLQAGELGHVDLLKVGHHGSLSSTTPAFLSATMPTDAAISCGLRNFYEHPRRGTLDKLEKAEVPTYRTDLLGEEDFLLKPEGVIAYPWAEQRR